MVIFGPLPTTATGKIQKFEQRQRARALRASLRASRELIRGAAPSERVVVEQWS